jgi:hypothetical protein
MMPSNQADGSERSIDVESVQTGLMVRFLNSSTVPICPSLLLSPRLALEKSGPSATACGSEAGASVTAFGGSR